MHLDETPNGIPPEKNDVARAASAPARYKLVKIRIANTGDSKTRNTLRAIALGPEKKRKRKVSLLSQVSRLVLIY